MIEALVNIIYTFIFRIIKVVQTSGHCAYLPFPSPSEPQNGIYIVLRKVIGTETKAFSQGELRPGTWERSEDPFHEIFLKKTTGDRAIPATRHLLSRHVEPETLADASYDDVKIFFEKIGLLWQARWLIELSNL